MKIAPFLFLLVAFVATAHADEKMDAIIEAFAVEEDFKAAAQALKPVDASSTNSAETSDIDQMLSRHYREKMFLFDRYIKWELFRSDFVKAFTHTYSEAEINALYTFVTSEHGASYYKKYDEFGQSFVAVFSTAYAQYEQEASDLSDKHQQEIDQRIEELKKEAENEEPIPEDASREPDIGDIVRFVVKTENGQMLGYDVRPGRKNELFEKSPFEYDDMVLSVNGIRVNEPDNIREAYNILTTNSEVHFQVRRDGEPVDFVIDIPALASTGD